MTAREESAVPPGNRATGLFTGMLRGVYRVLLPKSAARPFTVTGAEGSKGPLFPKGAAGPFTVTVTDASEAVSIRPLPIPTKIPTE